MFGQSLLQNFVSAFSFFSLWSTVPDPELKGPTEWHPTIVVQQIPRVAPDSTAQVFRFSVRGGESADFSPLNSPSLVSDPLSWKVSLEERGTSLYATDRDGGVVLEQMGKIVATFKVDRHGLRDLRMVLKTIEAADITNWGGGQSNPTNDHATVQVSNRNFVTAAGYLRQAGLGIFVVSRQPESKLQPGSDPYLSGAKLPIYWSKIDSKTHQYYIGGQDLDVYVSHIPMEGNDEGNRGFLKFLWGITGRPNVPPPIYALGFLAGRWGWEDRQYISSVLDEFDLRAIPIDAFVMDFEWYLNMTGGDYLIPLTGLTDYPDFRFGNVKTFPDVRNQAKEFIARNVRFGGIRKPRLGDSELIALAQSKGWMLNRNGRQKSSRDLNFALQEVREWYAEQTRNMMNQYESLPNFFWNDEGETNYFTYHHWIEAEQLSDSHIADGSRKRRFSLNRAYTPGVQRLESFAVWTGDVPTTWQSLRENVDMLCRWSEAGAPLVTFDIGGFQGEQGPGYEELLVRWYQLGVFAGVMRVHSTLTNKPHFPFMDLWGAEPATAMRNAIHFRYALMPTIMAAMYEMRNEAVPWIERRPDVDPKKAARDFLCADRRLFVVPVVEPAVMNNVSTTVEVEFPAEARWYPLKAMSALIRSPKESRTNVALDEILVYAREGSIVLFHGTDPIQTTRATEMVGGNHTLLIVIFSSEAQDAVLNATLVEDDGETNAEGTVRYTKFQFTQSSLTLTWTTEGSQSAPKWYNDAKVILRQPTGDEIEVCIDPVISRNVDGTLGKMITFDTHNLDRSKNQGLNRREQSPCTFALF